MRATAFALVWLAAVGLGLGGPVPVLAGLLSQEVPPSDSEETGEPEVTSETPPAPSEAPADAPSESALPTEAEAGLDGEAQEQYATLILTADSPCTVYINNIPIVAIASPEESHEIPIFTPTATLIVLSAVALGARFDTAEDEILVFEKGEIREFAIPMLETIEEFRKLERRQSVFRDLKTGLMWARNDNATDITWTNAASYCEVLELGAYQNWRMPSSPELETLEAKWSLRPFKIADPIYLSSCCIWSETRPSDGVAYTLDFRYRRRFETNLNLSYSLRALCVRDMLATEVADALVAADPKEQKRRLKEKRQRLDERKRRKAEKAAKKAARDDPPTPDGG